MLLTPAKDLLNIFFPDNCAGCGKSLFAIEDAVCFGCLEKLPKTNYWTMPENPIVQKFWGRVSLQFASAFCFQNKDNITQRLIHQLKYKEKTEVGIVLGRLVGHCLQQPDSLYPKIDAIVPLPLHPTKERKRGYNQCSYLAQGIADVMELPVFDDVAKRVVANVSQTQKDKFGRWENVAGIFAVINADKIKNKHLLLIDDVVTTGSTIESCATALLTVPEVNVSVLAFSFPQD